MKAAYITHILKKADMDSADAKSYRPISNLSVISKLLERLIAKQLVGYFKDNNLLPDLQSAYRPHHSTETAVLKVLADIFLALDSGNLVMLTLLDLSAAFDSVDHNTSVGCENHTVSVASVLTGLNRTRAAAHSTCALHQPVQNHLRCSMDCPRDRSLGRFCSYCILQTCYSWSCHHLTPHA